MNRKRVKNATRFNPFHTISMLIAIKRQLNAQGEHALQII